jgi:hypothetical protein
MAGDSSMMPQFRSNFDVGAPRALDSPTQAPGDARETAARSSIGQEQAPETIGAIVPQ